MQTLASAVTASMAGCGSISDRLERPDEGPVDSGKTNESNTPEMTESGVNGVRETQTEQPTQTPAEEAAETDQAWSVDDVTLEPPADPFSSVPLPEESTPYPRMGSADDTATLYGSWKCPYTRAFVVRQLPELVDEFVRSGDLSLEYRAVAYRGGEPFLGTDAPQATRAGLGVWETEPDSFWQYFTYVFTNQPQERYRWAKPELLVRFATAADLQTPEQIGRVATEETFTGRIERTVVSAERNDIWTVPRIVYDGEVTAPTVDPTRTRTQLERARDR